MITSFRGKYNFLSNFSSHPVNIGDITYKTAECAYQAYKVSDMDIRRAIAKMDPKDAKAYVKGIKHLPSDWKEKSLAIMGNILIYKVLQNPHVAEALVNTGDERIVEGNNWGDTFWGVDLKTNTGQNMLGNLWMEIRYIMHRYGIDALKYHIQEEVL